jgi:hypothetical protein
MLTLTDMTVMLEKFSDVMSPQEYRAMCKMRQLALVLNAIRSLRQKRIDQAKAQAREQQAIRLLPRLNELRLFDEFPVRKDNRKKVC